MRNLFVSLLLFLLIPFYGAFLCAAGEMPLDVLQFPENKEAKLVMFPTRQVPESLMSVEVKVETDGSRIEVRTERVFPAVLFGGEVTCYVLWSINRGGIPLNLGEIWVEPGKDKEKLDFETSMKSFALIVTAETHSTVEKPSELVIFWNDRVSDPQVPTDSIHFQSFEPAPATDISELNSRVPQSSKPAELIQAEVAYSAAMKEGADTLSQPEFAQATIFLDRARKSTPNSKDQAQYSRSSFQASSQALVKSKRLNRLQNLRSEIDSANANITDLEGKLEDALNESRQQQETISQLRSENSRALQHTRELEEQREGLRNAMTDLELRLSDLRREKQGLESGLESVQQENRTLQENLLEALSLVAETQRTDRGLVLKLPDILFDAGSDTLKQEAKLVLAKLAGILLITRDQNLRIEGHTDSTGSSQLNLDLSKRRAAAVAEFLTEQNIQPSRMVTEGYGKERPIADNRTAQGRRQNRRVEIIIAEGEISELIQ